MAVALQVMEAGECLAYPTKGHAKRPHSCATLNGVDTFVVQRADELAICSANGEDLVAACARISRGEEEDLKDAVGDPLHYRIPKHAYGPAGGASTSFPGSELQSNNNHGR